MRISDWSSDVCSSDLVDGFLIQPPALLREMSSGDRALMITLTEEYLRRMRAFGYDDKTALELVDPQSRDDLERLMGLVGSPLQRRWTEPFTLAAYQEVVSADRKSTRLNSSQ